MWILSFPSYGSSYQTGIGKSRCLRNFSDLFAIKCYIFSFFAVSTSVFSMLATIAFILYFLMREKLGRKCKMFSLSRFSYSEAIRNLVASHFVNAAIELQSYDVGTA